MLSSTIESVRNNETVKQMIEYLEPYQDRVSQLYSSNKYFRIIAICSISFSSLWITRNIYLKLWRKLNGYPDGPYGIPLFGNALNFLDPFWLITLNKYGPVVHVLMGPSLSVITFNNSNLIKKIYHDPRTTDINKAFAGDTDIMFISTNGKEWETRRRIVYANLMSTLKATFVEEATKNFIKNKVFPVFNKKIRLNQAIMTKPLLLSIFI